MTQHGTRSAREQRRRLVTESTREHAELVDADVAPNEPLAAHPVSVSERSIVSGRATRCNGSSWA